MPSCGEGCQVLAQGTRPEWVLRPRDAAGGTCAEPLLDCVPHRHASWDQVKQTL